MITRMIIQMHSTGIFTRATSCLSDCCSASLAVPVTTLPNNGPNGRSWTRTSRPMLMMPANRMSFAPNQRLCAI
ncbi:MAG: hypothetical protein DI584_13020 [Stenotrophomonas sp.]|nr:MAG: hypothetical protein DI584_13020 [Stenotrophomonas sp.]